MAINQKQVLSLQQKLSPQQIQMIKLLELPTVQLEQRIKQEIEDNIVLEEEDRAAEDEEQPQQISVDEYLREDDTPSYKSRINNYSKDDKQRPVFLTEGRSLQEYLIEQLGFRNLSEREMKLAVYLVGSIDEDGYLRRDLESVADDIAFTVGIETSAEELEKLLGIIHELEPAGIGARNLQECLLLQMAQIPVNSRPRRLARKILTAYFDEFVKKHYEKLMSRLQVSEDDFREAIAEIRHLSPKPGNLYAEGGTDTTPYIIPDFILDYQDGRFQLSLNSYNVPEVRVNRRYMDMIREMVRRNCLIGLNYCKSFITDGGIGDSPDDLYRHIEHFFSLGAYENIALGSDFDGATLPTYLNTPAKAADLYEYFLEKGMSKDLAEGIMFRNAEKFFRKNL